MKRDDQVRIEVEMDFERMEKLARSAQPGPGVFDLSAVYGGYDAALQQARAYLGLLDLHPSNILTSDSSNR
jgi:hypothetical protein